MCQPQHFRNIPADLLLALYVWRGEIQNGVEVWRRSSRKSQTVGGEEGVEGDDRERRFLAQFGKKGERAGLAQHAGSKT